VAQTLPNQGNSREDKEHPIKTERVSGILRLPPSVTPHGHRGSHFSSNGPRY